MVPSPGNEIVIELLPPVRPPSWPCGISWAEKLGVGNGNMLCATCPDKSLISSHADGNGNVHRRASYFIGIYLILSSEVK